MILFFSGGGSPWIAEKCLSKPTVMLSYFTNVNQKSKKMDSRFRRLLKVKRKKNESQS